MIIYLNGLYNISHTHMYIYIYEYNPWTENPHGKQPTIFGSSESPHMGGASSAPGTQKLSQS